MRERGVTTALTHRAQEWSSKGENRYNFWQVVFPLRFSSVTKTWSRYCTGAINFSFLSVHCDEFGSCKCQAGNQMRNLWQSCKSTTLLCSTVTGPFLGWMCSSGHSASKKGGELTWRSRWGERLWLLKRRGCLYWEKRVVVQQLKDEGVWIWCQISVWAPGMEKG